MPLRHLVVGILAVCGLIAVAGCGDSTGTTNNNSDLCGNDQQEDMEECDGTDLSYENCFNLGFHLGGTLGCTTTCEFDLSGCYGCGNGTVEGAEECEGDDLQGQNCESLGFEGGSMTCFHNCTFDQTDCIAPLTCGDGVIESPEECDGDNLAGQTCWNIGLGFNMGDLACTDNCTLGTSRCGHDLSCGNGVWGAGEECDGSEMAGATCESLGYADGTLACTGNCTFDTSFCGDPIEICNNAMDDDGDGAVDCSDDDCCYEPYCDCWEDCDNGVDDDGDGAVDCDDIDCTGVPPC